MSCLRWQVPIPFALAKGFSHRGRSAIPVGTYELAAFPVIRRLGGATGGAVYEFGFLAVILRLGGATGTVTEGFCPLLLILTALALGAGRLAE